ncbi:hypothetical protein D5086_015790 [Populus alba]|uniref:Uncharacterized protein n=1 Tax=Populus alba TaxID=43335 RepID=A0ACC4BS61_POPAL
MADNPTSPAAGSHESGGEQSPRSGGDAKGSVRGGDGSSKRDAVGGLPGQNAQAITTFAVLCGVSASEAIYGFYPCFWVCYLLFSKLNARRLMKVPPPRLRGLSAGTAYDPSFHARQRVGFGFDFVNSVNWIFDLSLFIIDVFACELLWFLDFERQFFV